MRDFEISDDELWAILDKGIRCGYFKFKDISDGEGIKMLRLAVEGLILDRELNRVKHSA